MVSSALICHAVSCLVSISSDPRTNVAYCRSPDEVEQMMRLAQNQLEREKERIRQLESSTVDRKREAEARVNKAKEVVEMRKVEGMKMLNSRLCAFKCKGDERFSLCH